MRLTSFTLINFRKFRTEDNTVKFASSGILPRDDESFQDGTVSDESSETSIGTTTTLAIGKNNAGKSTVVSALTKLYSGERFVSDDFNYAYLQEVLNAAKEQEEGRKSFAPPEIAFRLRVALGSDDGDLVSNVYPFLRIDALQSGSDIEIVAKWSAKERSKYEKNLATALEKDRDLSLFHFKAFIDEQVFSLKYFAVDGSAVHNFTLKSLLNLESIDATDAADAKCLSRAFNRIAAYRYKHDLFPREEVDSWLGNMCDDIDKKISGPYAKIVNEVVEKEAAGRELEAVLTADVTFDKIMGSLLRYEYKDNGHIIPEGQFGLGYTRLMMTIAHIIEHIDKAENEEKSSKINLIVLEEPENHMHPQMQEFFISYIANVVDALIKSTGRAVLNTQLLITTHSDHIVHSKVQSGRTFDYINYIQERNGEAHVIVLQDESVKPEGDKSTFDFLKRHMRLSHHGIFFADGIIFVEGMTERLLLPLYINERPALRKHYIVVVEVSGAHAYVYSNLLKALRIPCAIITDLDIERTKEEKAADIMPQVRSLVGRVTTNKTLQLAMQDDEGKLDNLSSIIPLGDEGKVTVYTQEAYGDIFPTSFEEALILANYDKSVLNAALQKVRPGIFSEFVGKETDEDYQGNIENSSHWQKTLSSNGKKGEFATELLFRLIEELEKADNRSTSEFVELPAYMSSALDWLELELEG